MKEQELLAELDATKREARAKDQAIRVLTEKLQANQVKMSSLNCQLEQEQRRKRLVWEMMYQKSEWNIYTGVNMETDIKEPACDVNTM